MSYIKKILAVSRMTTYCNETIKYAIYLAWQYDAELLIIHLAQNPHYREEQELPPGCSEKDFVDTSVNSKAALAEILRDVQLGGLHVKELVKEGDPVEEILRTIDDEHIDIVVLWPSEESQPEHSLFGHINEELIRRKACQIIFVQKNFIKSKN